MWEQLYEDVPSEPHARLLPWPGIDISPHWLYAFNDRAGSGSDTEASSALIRKPLSNPYLGAFPQDSDVCPLFVAEYVGSLCGWMMCNSGVCSSPPSVCKYECSIRKIKPFVMQYILKHGVVDRSNADHNRLLMVVRVLV